MTLTITDDLITSDRVQRYAWRGARGTWFTSWTATCFWDTRAEAEARMRYAEHVEADGPHPQVTDDEVDRWSTAIDQWTPTTRLELRAGHLVDNTLENDMAPDDLYEKTTADSPDQR